MGLKGGQQVFSKQLPQLPPKSQALLFYKLGIEESDVHTPRHRMEVVRGEYNSLQPLCERGGLVDGPHYKPW